MATAERATARVYVVDDERMITRTLGTILRKEGYDATSFHDPLELLSAVEQVEPDLVITDIIMPHMNGVDLAIQLQKTHPACKVLLCSGQTDSSDLLEAARQRGHEFEVFSKPMHPLELLQHVRAALGKVVRP